MDSESLRFHFYGYVVGFGDNRCDCVLIAQVNTGVEANERKAYIDSSHESRKPGQFNIKGRGKRLF